MLPEESVIAPKTDIPPLTRRGRWRRFWHWEYTGLLVILLVTLGFHFAAIERPGSIIWDEKWYVGDARSIMTGGGDVRPEHPPLAKLFIIAGEYIFNGFKVPQRDSGQVLLYPISSEDKAIIVSDSSGFKIGMNLAIDKEQLNITGIDYGTNQINVDRDIGGTGVTEHSVGVPVMLFTDNAFGWRFFSVVFGTLGIVVFFFICRQLKFSLIVTTIATFLFALENMTYLHSGLALLDVFMVAFMLGAILFYLRENYLLAGVLTALSAQCKLAGVLIIIALVLHFIIYRRTKWARFITGLLVAAVSYLAFMVIFEFFINGSFVDPVIRIINMLDATAANVFTVPKLSISSYPWTWVYPQFVQLYYNSPNEPFIIYSYDPQYISFISTTVQIVILPVVAYMVYKAVKGSRAAGLVALWFLAAYLIWIPLTIISNRVTFVFYFLAATPAICLGISIVISDILGWLKTKRERAGRTTAGVKAWYAVICFYLTVHLAIFVVFNPAIPTFIKTWLPPFSVGVETTSRLLGPAQYSEFLVTLIPG